MAARTLCYLGITLLMTDTVDARQILIALVDRERWIVRTDIGSVAVTARACCDDIPRVDGRLWIPDGNNAVRTMACCTLNNARATTKRQLSVHALLQEFELPRGNRGM
jgi:hypothetical protein